MSFVRYEVEGIILGQMPSGEGSKIVLLFTANFGLVYALAQGAREGKSKLKFVLQDGAMLHASLIHGREKFRLVDAVLLNNPFSFFKNNQEDYLVFVRWANLLRRMIKGQTPQPELFLILKDQLLFLENHHLDHEARLALEILGTGRILITLGYLSEKIINKNAPISTDTLTSILKNRSQILVSINKAIKESHL